MSMKASLRNAQLDMARDLLQTKGGISMYKTLKKKKEDKKKKVKMEKETMKMKKEFAGSRALALRAAELQARIALGRAGALRMRSAKARRITPRIQTPHRARRQETSGETSGAHPNFEGQKKPRLRSAGGGAWEDFERTNAEYDDYDYEQKVALLQAGEVWPLVIKKHTVGISRAWVCSAHNS
jgi:hypothetical protein